MVEQGVWGKDWAFDLIKGIVLSAINIEIEKIPLNQNEKFCLHKREDDYFLLLFYRMCW